MCNASVLDPIGTTPRRRAARARHAASLIVLRGRGDAAEMLMGVRGAAHRFMPNKLVFPGGAVDAADLRAAFASPLRPDTQRLLEKSADPRLAVGLAIAAARELAEETGLSLGTPPALDMMHYLCRAITPGFLPIRFNARFLVVEAATVRGSLGGSGELEGLRWFGMQEALALDLASPTRMVIEELRAWLSLSDQERRARGQTSVLRDRAWQAE
jgi:8-oxo-dGTP pyrophosphatase MutT (NUDIX family)